MEIYQAPAVAMIKGGNGYPGIRGSAMFRQRENGVLVTVSISGLPQGSGSCSDKIFAMHIHGGSACSGDTEDNFKNSGVHYNPDNCRHPYHAGDLPPLFGCDGKAYLSVLTDRFELNNIIGKTLVIHASYDDFTTQPSGNSGTKIACGVILSTNI